MDALTLSRLRLSRPGVVVLVILLLAGGIGAFLFSSRADNGPAQKKPAPARPALSVSVVTPQLAEWPVLLAANGNIAPWQEAVIGAEIGGQRITEVLVNVGDVVKQGQLL